MSALKPAPDLDVSHWFNTDGRLSLAALKGPVVMLTAFQNAVPGFCGAKPAAGATCAGGVSRA